MGVSSLCEVYVFEEMYYLRNGITQTNITCVTKWMNIYSIGIPHWSSLLRYNYLINCSA